ncbi:MAG: hypothetical protein COT25_00165 [Candidatus Kerfeldbacteria bacterium CG08_land_8_20_14_0_20_42_7]|uniref:Uncharacterized protein n=1 Tax=Candidatus Kerfeldbacteria bacterium CG08_land_8_20_14_0_20_42_7 TaxID=2014245 RepID=A0A2H0YU13_9BACT|nr:MAG: hypothetical protein COT25_00165 [Candidatus Kerfeldbacteria bacterium CG08_land_8_20_14_0_20_42_7]
MRTILFFVIFTCVAFMGCADMRHLTKEGLIPAAEMSAEKASVKSGVQITVDQNNLAEMKNSRRITFTGMTPGAKFIYVAKDNSRQERTVDGQGTVSFLYPKTFTGVNVFYGYTKYVGRWIFLQNPVETYQWNTADTTFNPPARREP